MNNGKQKWIFWLVGTITSIIVISISTLTANVVANDKDSRDRDDKIEHYVTTELKEFRKETNQTLTKMLVALAEIKKDDDD